jgi:prepilin-type N-terminal cleavage/methylation domain-containing protein
MKRSSTRGFTLLETLVAITILTIAVSGPLYVADRALVAAQVSRDQLTASYLAQEGIEYMRAMRDREFLTTNSQASPDPSQDSWEAYIYGTGSWGTSVATMANCKANACYLDPTQPMGFGSSLTACGSTCTNPLYRNPSGRYTQSTASGNVKTIFKRGIRGTLLSNDDFQITSTVTWVNRGTTYTVTATDNLTPWQ